jgi:hypothetical protein
MVVIYKVNFLLRIKWLIELLELFIYQNRVERERVFPLLLQPVVELNDEASYIAVEKALEHAIEVFFIVKCHFDIKRGEHDIVLTGELAPIGKIKII